MTLRQKLDVWLDQTWEKNLNNRTQSVELYELVPVDSPTVFLAYAVNRFRHNRIREAGEAVDAALSIAPENLDARLLSVWAKTVRDQYDSAMTSIRTLGKTIQNRNLPAAKLDNTYRRIGRLLGYLQGPVGDQVNQEILRAAIGELSVGLAPHHQELVRQEMNTVITDYEERLKHLDKKVEQSVKENEVAKDADRKLINQENALLKSQDQQIQNRQKQVTDEGKLKIDQAITKLQPLQSELASLEAEIQFARQNTQALQTALFFNLNDPNGSLLQSDVLRYQLQDSFFRLSILGRRADAVAFDLNRGANEIAQIRNRYGGELSQLERDLNNSVKKQRRNSKRLAKLANPTKPNNKKVALLNNRISALNSYDQLPLELYRADLLNAIGKP
jgi:chromosome segregation ATPase